MTPPRAIMLAARLDRGGVADHVQLLSNELNALESPTVAATPGTMGKQPDWIGLHFVCYAWARQGILRSADIEQLKSLCARSRVAVYMHELWIGESITDSFKHRVIGPLQKHGIKRLLSEVAPTKIFTSTPIYQAMLAAEGFAADILPLPGNIPLSTAQDAQTAQAWLNQREVHPDHSISLAAVFGTIHPEWQPIEAMRDWAQACRLRKQKPVLLTIGRHGSAGSASLAKLQSAISDLRIVSIGEQPAALVAGLLANCNFGWATSPWALIGKSGSASAFLESGLPVIVTRNDWQWRRGTTPAPEPHPQLHLWTPGNPSLWSEDLLKRTKPESRLRSTAMVWMNLFTQGDSA